MRNAPLTDLALALAIILMIGWLLVNGRGLLMPILVAVIVVYVLTRAAETIRRIPLVGALPSTIVNLLLLALFSLVFFALALIVVNTVNELIRVAPTYQDNLMSLVARLADLLDIDDLPNWADVQAMTLERIDIRATLVWVTGSLTSIGAVIFLVIIYAAFMVREQVRFPAKLAAAFPQEGEAERLRNIIREINRKIGDYLAVKTLVNVVLGIISYAILWAIDVDFAPFWALLIGLANYIPYFGSMLGVALPVLLSMAQFASVSTTLLLVFLLSGAQIYVGGFLEPRLVGREMNLSPLVVLITVAFWSSIWGLMGAIVAVPLTSVIVIILNSFERTRFVTILMADRPLKARQLRKSK